MFLAELASTFQISSRKVLNLQRWRWGLWKEVCTDQRTVCFASSARPEKVFLSLQASVSLRSIKCLGRVLDFPLGIKLCHPHPMSHKWVQKSREEKQLRGKQGGRNPTSSVGTYKDTPPQPSIKPNNGVLHTPLFRGEICGQGGCWTERTSRQYLSSSESQAGSCAGTGPSWDYLHSTDMIYFPQTSGLSAEIPEGSCEHESPLCGGCRPTGWIL